MFPDLPVTFTTYDQKIAHARRAGSRMSVCGEYVYIAYKYRETILPQSTLCGICEQELIKEIGEAIDDGE